MKMCFTKYVKLVLDLRSTCLSADLKKTVTSVNISDITSEELGTSALALLRLQSTYKLRTEDVALGYIHKKQVKEEIEFVETNKIYSWY